MTRCDACVGVCGGQETSRGSLHGPEDSIGFDDDLQACHQCLSAMHHHYNCQKGTGWGDDFGGMDHSGLDMTISE